MVKEAVLPNGDANDRKRLHDRWLRKLMSSIKTDGWGQVIEAVDAYTDLANEIAVYAPTHELSENDSTLLHRMVSVLKARCAINSGDEQKDDSVYPSAEDMKCLVAAFEELFSTDKSEYMPFPLNLEPLSEYTTQKHWLDETTLRLQKPSKPGGVLIPASEIHSGGTHVTLEIIDVGIKCADTFTNPFVRMTVMDRKGNCLEPKQETPVADRQSMYKVDINTIVHIQSSIEEIREKDAAIFLEFVHYKTLKHKNSTKAWAVLETDELSPDLKVLEIYKKPVEKTRTKFKLLTTKKLFFQVRVHINQ